MNAFFKKHDFLYRSLLRLMSLVLAFALWVVVMSQEDPERQITIENVSVQFTGTDAIMVEHNLAIVEGQDSTVNLQVRGHASDIADMDKNKIVVTADVSKITAPGEQTLSYSVDLPDPSKTELVRGTPSTVTVNIDQYIAKSVPIATDLSGEPADGYLYDKMETDVSELKVEGPESLLSRIAKARVIVKADKLSATKTLNCDFVFIDLDGNTVESPLLQCETKTVNVTVPVQKLVTAKLAVTLKPSADVTADMAKVTISPESVQVYGNADVISKLKEINLGTIDLATEQTGAEKTMKILLPDGVKLAEGESETAKVKLTLDGVTTRDITITEIALKDTNTAPDKLQTTLKTTSIKVTLRGKSSALQTFNVTSVRAEAEFNSAQLGAGLHSVPVTVTIPNGSGVTLVKTQDVNIEVGATGQTDGTE